MSTAQYEPDEHGTPSKYFAGFAPRNCREHRTVGGRAWCFDCSEWCYPIDPCNGCHDIWVFDQIEALPELHASTSRDYGRGYAAAIKDVLEILKR
jgi:hypothetical protein